MTKDSSNGSRAGGEVRVRGVGRRLRVPLKEFSFQFVRSSGSGGQNVNKVNSKAILRWPVLRSPSLPDDVRTRFTARFRRRLTQGGELVLTSQRFRDQKRNVADCLAKVEEMLQEVARAPKQRRGTRPSRAVEERRRERKRELSEKKRRRRPVRESDV